MFAWGTAFRGCALAVAIFAIFAAPLLAQEEKEPPKEPPKEGPMEPVALVRTWTGLNGTMIKAKFIRVLGENVIIQKGSQPPFGVLYQNLSIEDRKYVRDFLDQIGKSAQLPPTDGKRGWRIADDYKYAAFVRVKDGKVHIWDDGVLVKESFDKLSADDRKYVRGILEYWEEVDLVPSQEQDDAAERKREEEKLAKERMREEEERMRREQRERERLEAIARQQELEEQRLKLEAQREKERHERELALGPRPPVTPSFPGVPPSQPRPWTPGGPPPPFPLAPPTQPVVQPGVAQPGVPTVAPVGTISPLNQPGKPEELAVTHTMMTFGFLMAVAVGIVIASLLGGTALMLVSKYVCPQEITFLQGFAISLVSNCVNLLVYYLIVVTLVQNGATSQTIVNFHMGWIPASMYLTILGYSLCTNTSIFNAIVLYVLQTTVLALAFGIFVMMWSWKMMIVILKLSTIVGR